MHIDPLLSVFGTGDQFRVYKTPFEVIPATVGYEAILLRILLKWLVLLNSFKGLSNINILAFGNRFMILMESLSGIYREAEIYITLLDSI